MLIGRKGAFDQNAGHLGRWWTQHPPETTSEDSAGLWKLLKGNREATQLIIEMGVRVVAKPHCVQACWLLMISL